MEPIVLPGADAFSAFRMDALKRKIAERLGAGPGRLEVEARFVYLLDAEGPLPEETAARVRALLGASDRPFAGEGFLVTPRRGTISPWSSKATDIFKNCGVRGVRRVERGVRYRISLDGRALGPGDLRPAADALHDRMTEGMGVPTEGFFDSPPPAPGRVFDVLGRGAAALEEANVSMGLALSAGEMAYLCENYVKARRNPTDTELVMFGQVNSEHCRHKIFNAGWVIDGEPQDMTLFGMIRNTHLLHPEGTLVAYRDNSGVAEGFEAGRFAPDAATRVYRFGRGRVDLLMKVETHNHPTAISPFPGAATGVGGEIRDEAATGTGSRTKAGISGFMVSNLNVPGLPMPWEKGRRELPGRLASPLAIMIEGPIGGAAFGNEFGRPQLCGFFRTYEETVAGRDRGFHKPVMVAGGMGNIRRCLVQKKEVPPGALIAQLGGPALRIGLGGGAASSMVTGSNDEALDFDSVQRGNAEMERRCQEVIDACTALGEANPILSIHDIGAGGLSNGCPELIEKTGGDFELRSVHNEEPSMSPMEIWCCEAQERYVLAILPEDRAAFEAVCARERCPVAFIGRARDDRRLVLNDSHFRDRPIDMDIRVLLGKPPRMVREAARIPADPGPLDLDGVPPQEAFERILSLPAVADKTFLVTIADRSVTGLVHRDQMAGRFQLPVADNAVTLTDYTGYTGEAMATAERPPAALVSAPASGRLAVAEALTNLASAPVGDIGNVKLSANWMCACGEPGEDAALFDTVRAVGMEFCPALGVSIPVGKDSLSMRTVWNDAQGRPRRQVAPLSLVVSAFSTVADVRKAVTPDLKPGPSSLLLVDLSEGRDRLGASALAQVYNRVGPDCADMDDPLLLRRFFEAVQDLLARGLLLAYHDRSDGGAAVTLAEMAMAGGRGLEASLEGASAPAALFSEEPGAVLQVADERLADALDVLARHGIAGRRLVRNIGRPSDSRAFTLSVNGKPAIKSDLTRLRRAWSRLTCAMQSLRDNPACARQEYEAALDPDDPGMTFRLTYDPDEKPPAVEVRRPPRMAILREQGINGHIEMAAAFALAGFEAVDVHMTDLLSGREDLASFSGLAACGGFSYGDVLGAGAGWAACILYNDRLLRMFRAFFARPGTVTLGVCNGCQMVSQLKGIIPGAGHWPSFQRNASEQFEARYATVEVLDSPSVFLRGMAGSRLPIAVAHGEGRAAFAAPADAAAALPALRYVDGRGRPAERYPLNPNGSAGGLTGFTSEDGRATIMMPHPERGFRSVQLSYRPAGLFTGEAGPWMRMFRNAYAFAARGAR